MTPRRWTLAALAGLTLAAPAPAQDGGPEEEPRRIAVVGPFTGPAAAFGASIRAGAELARAARPDGPPLVLVFRDDGADPARGRALAAELAADPSVVAAVAHFNSPVLAAARPSYTRGGLPAVTGGTNPSLCAGSAVAFRVLPHDARAAGALVRYAADVFGAGRVAVAFERGAYGRTLRGAIADEAASRPDVELVAEAGYTRGRTADFGPIARQLLAAEPDAVLIAGLYVEGGLLTRALRAEPEGAQLPVLAGDGCRHEGFVELAGSAAEGVVIATPGSLELHNDPAVDAFRTAYREATGADPDLWAALAHDATALLLDAAAAAGPERDAIRAWLAARRGPDTAWTGGLLGPVWFDAEGDCASREPAFEVVRQGTFFTAEEQLAAPGAEGR